MVFNVDFSIVPVNIVAAHALVLAYLKLVYHTFLQCIFQATDLFLTFNCLLSYDQRGMGGERETERQRDRD